jgi:AraC-like DNA-binding protein
MGHDEAAAELEKALHRPTVPGTYVLLWVSLLEARGVSAEQLLAGTGLTRAELWGPEVRTTPMVMSTLTMRGIGLTGDPTLGYAFGFEMKPTAHGALGYAAMTCSTLGGSIRLLERYMRLRLRAAHITLTVTGELAIITLQDQLMPGLVRQFSLEVITAAMVRAADLLLGERVQIEIWLDHREPSYFERVRSQLPTVRFDMPRVELRFPREYLDRPLAMADPLASHDAVLRLERELSLLDEVDATLLAKVREQLQSTPQGFPDLQRTARQLGLSERTLKRKLQRAGTSFQKLLDEARLMRASSMLESSAASVETIASLLGYNDPANFTRAFRRWTGKSPRAFRASQGR